MKLHSAAFCFFLGIAPIALSQAGAVLSPGLSEAERQVQMAERQVDMRPREQRAAGTSMVEMQREARELRDLSDTIPQDVSTTFRGLLPNDLTNRLKRIEKLAKSLRSQLDRQQH